ncbi:MAG: FtsH protease activity modulator HflK [Pseudomonadota bacterium]|nr:FtsH protease activity modulator HflK [Pseudomonadota bacterium]
MAWNDSGNGNKNPWDRNSGPNSPPDLDKIIRDWQKKFAGIFGGTGGSSSQKSGDNGLPVLGLLVIVLLGWAATGFYIVDAAEKGVVQRFGAYTRTSDEGLRWRLPWPFESVDIVNVSVDDYLNQTTSMLTSDENIVLVDMVVQYNRGNPLPYLFDVEDPVGTLADVSESAIREVIGKSDMDYILGAGREQIAAQTKEVIQSAVNDYSAGIIVTQVTLQDVNFPGQVEAAVQDAIKAREDKERLKFEAESYANDILPKARGAAVRQLQDADAYRQRVTADAEGEAARFTALLTEYSKAPRVTRERLYIDAIEDVYGNSSKVLLDAEGSGNLLYLPVDKLMEQSANRQNQNTSNSASLTQGGQGSMGRSQERNASRERGAR